MEKRHKIIILAVSIVIIVVTSVAVPLIIYSNNPSFNTQKLSQFNTGGTAVDVLVVDDIAYVVDTADNTPGGLRIINVSDPIHPYMLGSYYEAGRLISVDVAGNIAYLANTLVGLEIVNVSDPSNPIKIDQYTGSGAVYDVQVIGEIAYVADWSRGLVILNVSDPSNVREIARYIIPGACIQLSISNNLAIITDHLSLYTGIKVINVEDPHNPVQVGNHAHNDVDFWNPFLYGDYVYIGNHGIGGGELRILDMNDPSDIVQAGLYDDGGSVNSIFVKGTIAYLADNEKGLMVVDVSNPSNPVKIAQFFDGGHAIDVYVVEDIVYIAAREDGLKIIKLLM